MNAQELRKLAEEARGTPISEPILLPPGMANQLGAGLLLALEVVEKAAGVVRTAHPEVGQYEVVLPWWTSLVEKLDAFEAAL